MANGVLYQLCARFDAQIVHHFVLVRFDGPRRDAQNRTNLLRRLALGQQLQHLALPLRQFDRLPLMAAGFVEVLLERRCLERRGDERFATQGRPDRRDEFIRGRVFQHIGRTAGLQCARRVNEIGVHRQKYDPGRAALLAKPLHGINAVQSRHGDVGHNDIGLERRGLLH